MIDEGDEDGFRFHATKILDGGANGRELAFGPIVIHDNDAGREGDASEDFVATGADNDALDADAGMASNFQKVFEEGAAAIGKKGFGRAHAAGLAAGEDDRGEHRSGRLNRRRRRFSWRAERICEKGLKRCGESR